MPLFRFDHKDEPMASPAKFAGRLMVNILVSFVLIGIALAIGIWGYMAFEHMDLTDAFLNSAMLLGGMGPMKTELSSEASKLFAGYYALGCGLVFVLASGVVLAPVLHRVLHALHAADDDDEKEEEKKESGRRKS